ncbi:MAG: AAA family ATPase [Bacteroidota bacterium]
MARIYEIRIRNFKVFGEEQIFEIRGKHLLIYGENGSGKSSLFWALYTFLQSSLTEKDVAKYFNRKHPESLLNLYIPDEDGYIELILDDDPTQVYRLSSKDLDSRQEPFISGNLSSDFITHRLLSNFYNYRNSREIDLWPVFRKDILPYTFDSAGANLADLSQYLENNQPYPRASDISDQLLPTYEEEVSDFENRLAEFNTELDGLIQDINGKATLYYDEHFNNQEGNIKITLSLVTPMDYAPLKLTRKLAETEEELIYPDAKVLNPPFIRLVIEQKVGKEFMEIPRPQSFLNEAKLTAIALSIRLSVLNDKPNTEFQILALDDLLVSLDMEHREEVLDIIFREYSDDYQLLILTHDRSFFQFARKYIQMNHLSQQWLQLEMYERISDNSGPVVKMAKEPFAKALQFYSDHEYAACGNHLRKSAEQFLQNFLPKRFQLSPRGHQITSLGKLIEKSCEYASDTGFPLELFKELEIHRDTFFNQDSHYNPNSNSFRKELKRGIKTLENLYRLKNKIIIHVDEILKIKFFLENGDDYVFHFLLRDDLRLLKDHSGKTSSFGKLRGEIVGYQKNGGELVKYQYSYKNKTLKEVYFELSGTLKDYTRENVLTVENIESSFISSAGKGLNDLKEY